MIQNYKLLINIWCQNIINKMFQHETFYLKNRCWNNINEWIRLCEKCDEL